MSLERWIEKIKAKPGVDVSPTVFVSDPEKIEGIEGIEICYLVIEDGVEKREGKGLEPGVYLPTNVTPKEFKLPALRNAITSCVASALMDRSSRIPSFGGLEVNYLNAIKFQPYAVSERGLMIFRLSPALPSEVDRVVSEMIRDNTLLI